MTMIKRLRKRSSCICHEAVRNHATANVPEALDATPVAQLTATTIIGQAAAVVGVAASVIYAAGALSLGLRLWYDQYEWEPVLGQLPRNFLLVDAVIVTGPAIALGVVAYPIYRKFGDSWAKQPLKKRWRVPVVAALILAAVPLVFVLIEQRDTIHGVIRPLWQIYVANLIFNVIFLSLASNFLPKIKMEGLREIVSVGILAFAFIPAVASVVAAHRFPQVVLCGEEFSNADQFSNYIIGDLIGTNGDWAYVAESEIDTPRPGKYVFGGGYIAVIPLSAVKLEAIGLDAGCDDLHSGGSKS